MLCGARQHIGARTAAVVAMLFVAMRWRFTGLLFYLPILQLETLNVLFDRCCPALPGWVL